MKSNQLTQIGSFTQQVVDLLSLNIDAGTPIYIGANNLAHIKGRHPAEYDLYYPRIGEILSDPDYVGKDPRSGSVDFVKLFQSGSEYIQVAVRVNASGKYIARTLFLLATYNAEKYISEGTLIKI